MKKIFVSMAIMIVTLGLLANGNIATEKSQVNPFVSKSNLREDVIIYQEDFENGLNGWTHYDGTLPSSMWHLDDFNTPEGSGLSWWMGDPELGGYINHLYVVMDTPEINVPAGGHLTFDLNWNCETPGGEPAGYDGWDGCNVRISTDGGNSWNVISGSPAYTNSSLYSFGFEHGEGTGIPGWCGSGQGWVNADFDLSAYAGQDVKIRFAFASDPAYCTQDNPAMFGMIVDNISLGSFDYDFNDGNEHGITYTSMVEVGGDIWYIGEVADAPSPTHAAICQNEQGTYNTGMLDYFESPTIHFPAGGEIKADFQIKGQFADNDQFPNVDFFGWEVSPDNGVTWYYMSNPNGDPNGMNYVYSDAPEIWASMIESYSLSGILSGYGMYEDQDVKFRIYFQSDDDAPQGTGIMIDDFVVINTIYPGPGPTDLMAMSNNYNRTVHLNWNPPESGGQEGWIGWDNGEYAGSLGLNDAGEWDVADRFTVGDVFPYAGGYVTKVKFIPADASCDYTVRVWTGSNAANLVAEVEVTNPVIDDWNEIDLPSPVLIESGQELWFGYHINQPAGGIYPAAYDSGPCEHGLYANLGSWQDLSGQFNYNWMIEAFVEAEDGRAFTISHNTNRDRDITGYNIYRSDAADGEYELIDTIEPAEEYVDTDPMLGTFNYYKVTALWDGTDSEYSNVAFDYVVATNEQEAARDDGSSEEGFNVGVAKSMAVKFSPDYSNSPECVLTHARVYIHSVNSGQLIIRAWDDDGGDGMPGTMLFQFVYPPADLHEGWNTIEIPSANQPTFTEGDFYLGIFEMAGLSEIGLDTNGSGYSYTDVTGSWEMETSGNIMIRAIAIGEWGSENHYGDIDDNGEVQAYDASLALQNAVGIIEFENWQTIRADVDGNGTVQAYDASLILQYAVGIIDHFPVEGREVTSPRDELEDVVITISDFDISAIEVGDNFEITVSTGELLEDWDVTAYQFDIHFDNSIINYSGYDLNGIIDNGGMVMVNDQEEGIISVGCITTSALSGSGSIIKLEFTKLAEGNTTLECTDFIYNTTSIVTINNSEITEVNDNDSVPMATQLISNYPNPFKPMTKISLNMPNSEKVALRIYNLKGQLVKTLVDDNIKSGKSTYVWNGTDEQNNKVASGLYFYKLETANRTVTKKMIMLK